MQKQCTVAAAAAANEGKIDASSTIVAEQCRSRLSCAESEEPARNCAIAAPDPVTGEAFRRAEMPEVAFDDSIAPRRMKSSKRRSTGLNMRAGSLTFFVISGT